MKKLPGNSGIFVAISICMTIFSCQSMREETPSLPKSPNVIVILTDDQGYGELSFHGNPILKTPNLDALASQSIRFTDYHAAPMCTPTRSQLLTGFDAARNGAINVNAGRSLLRPEMKTMADYFRENGYNTGIFGKWHLGDSYPYRPQNRGFEETLWFPSSHINSVPDHWNNEYFNATYWHNGEKKQYIGYCTDVFFSEAMRWIETKNKSRQPFFAYLPTNAPHGPLWAPQEDSDEIRKIIDQSEMGDKSSSLKQNLANYLGMVRNIDQNVGKLLSFLEKEELAENTIIVFSTDNGSTYGWSYYNAGMRGMKRQVWEGGHRVPFFIKWPSGDLGQPRDIDVLTQSQDLLPTLLELCGIEQGEGNRFDGLSLVPAMQNQLDGFLDRMFVINYGRNPFKHSEPQELSPARISKEGSVVLWKDWRYFHGLWKNTQNGYVLQDTLILTDLAADAMQQNNVIEQYPEVRENMKLHLDSWWDEVKDVANEVQPVFVGSNEENPTLISTEDWVDVFMDSQRTLRKYMPINSYCLIHVVEAGKYKFELQRWPKESGLALTDAAESYQVTRGVLPKGTALPIRSARIKIGEIEMEKRIEQGSAAVEFNVHLETGLKELQTWFMNQENEELCGAYYVYVTRI